MPENYHYLLSSLPMLTLGDAPKITSEELFLKCEDNLDPKLLSQLRDLDLVPSGPPCCTVDRQWQEWETCLRNTTVRLRASKHSLDADSWLRDEADAFPNDRRQIEETMAGNDPAACERALDEMRWQRLDDVSVMHDYDFDALVLYRLRLMLAEKWAGLSSEKGRGHLEPLVTNCVEQARAARTVAELPPAT